MITSNSPAPTTPGENDANVSGGCCSNHGQRPQEKQKQSRVWLLDAEQSGAKQLLSEMKPTEAELSEGDTEPSTMKVSEADIVRRSRAAFQELTCPGKSLNPRNSASTKHS